MTTNFRLRLLTLNTQLMDIPFLDDHDKVQKFAALIAARLVADQTPDVLCLNEVFDEDARSTLRTQLTPHWPHTAGPFGPTRTMSLPAAVKVATAIAGGTVAGIPGTIAALGVDALAELIVKQYGPEDSGLMIFSRHPIVKTGFHSYTVGEGWDWWADKGVAFASLQPNADMLVNLFISHTQASTHTITENSDIRADQFVEALQFISDNAQPDSNAHRALTILAGDLNVAGGPGARPEWDDYFATGHLLSEHVIDGWEAFISPAQSDWLSDPGATVCNHPDESDNPARLDYVLIGHKPAPVEAPRFVAQQMKLAHPGVSDHVGVYADINLETPHCYPADAELITDTNHHVPVDLPYGGMKWFRIARPGTWSFYTTEGGSCEVFANDNLSQRLTNNGVDNIALSGEADWASDLRTTAGTFELPPDTLVRVSFRSPRKSGTTYFGYLRHEGTSPHTPLLVKPQYPPKAPNFTAIKNAQVGPSPTQLWFRSEMQSTRYHNSVPWRFILNNDSGDHLRLTLIEWAGTPSETKRESQDGDSDVVITYGNANDRMMYWRVDRAPDQRDFSCTLQNPLTFMQAYISGDTKLPKVRCLDETGPTDWGADEIRMRMRPDSEGSEMGLMAEHDMNDDGPPIILVPGTNGTWLPEDTGFSNHLELTIIESDPDGPSSHSVKVPALPSDAYFQDQTVTLKFAGADYRYSMRLAREPYGREPQ